MKPSRRIFLISATAAALISAVPLQAQDKPALEVAFLYDNPVGDVGWVRQHDDARLALEEALGAEVKTKVVQVPTGADSERVMRQLAQGGTKLIYAVSFGYMNPMAKVAAQFPDTVFMNAQGFKTSKNMGVYSARVYEGFYLNGIVAGKTSKTGTVGFLASMPVPEVVQSVNAFALGMRSVNPDAVVKIVWLNTWYDPGREREAATALLSGGADVLSSILSSPVSIQVAEEKGAHAVAWQSDMAKYGPKAQLIATVLDWSPLYVANTKRVIEGTWESGSEWAGASQGVIRVSSLNEAVPADVKELVAKAEADLKSGSLKPFTGPIADQHGKERVAAGVSLSDDELMRLDWLSAGIQGSIPSN
ncbi:BMP family ABC transporter substrate-binding protein [Pseudaminobacter sp. NGMCC 1.201702]|uniref:BMP family ABC transporter substrate-binding protein n=1 Tax=Pseudaminobacter sp. NGMCC 1.201702 TaxID=3391825 RepID=UPI0039EFE71A